MATLTENKQARAALLRKAEAVVQAAENGSRALTAEETAELDATTAQIQGLNSRIDADEKLNSLRAQFPQGIIPSAGNPDADLPRLPAPAPFKAADVAPGRTLREALQSASPADVRQVRSFGNYLAGDMNALADLTPSGDGGIFIPTIIASTVARNYSAFSPVRDAANVWTTPAGEPARYPVISDTEAAVILTPLALTGADQVVSGSTPPTSITGPMLHAFKFSSKPVLFPRELISDANINVVEEVLSALLARITRTQNAKYTNGLGTTEPRGFMQDATPYSAGSVPLDLDIALDLAYSVPALYRPNGTYMASDVTVKYLRKLKTGLTGDKRALWAASFEDGNASTGTPARLHGWPLVINNDMDSVAADGTFAGVSPLAFGDFKKFTVREADSGAPYIYRFAVPANDGSACIAFKRSDSQLIVPAAISKLTV